MSTNGACASGNQSSSILLTSSLESSDKQPEVVEMVAMDTEQLAPEASMLVVANPMDPRPSVSNCYIFKSKLQEYAQKNKFLSPVYETIMEGPCHAPLFRSIVRLNGVTYDSLRGFSNRKSAEQSAAEMALLELSKSGGPDAYASDLPETGLCKNLLQEYTQQMSLGAPRYLCRNEEIQNFYCTVDIGGMKYTGGAAKSKKEAEIKAARIAIFSLKLDAAERFTRSTVEYQPSLLPSQRTNNDQKTADLLKVKNPRRNKKSRGFFRRGKRGGNKQTSLTSEVTEDQREGHEGHDALPAPAVLENGNGQPFNSQSMEVIKTEPLQTD